MKLFQAVIIMLLLSIQPMHGMGEDLKIKEAAEKTEQKLQQSIQLIQQEESERQRHIEARIRQEEAAEPTKASLTDIKIIKKLGVRPLIIIVDPLGIESKKSGTGALQQVLAAALNEPNPSAPMITTLDLAQNHYNEYGMWSGLGKWDIYTTRQGNNKEIKNNLVVFIPKSDKNIYIQALNAPYTAENPYNFTDDERSAKIHDLSLKALILGIKVDRLTREDPSKLDELQSTSTKGEKQNLPELFKEILISRIDFQGKESDEYLNRWDICLTAHGTLENLIASMPSATFSKLLDFFNTKINTRSLFYETCYGGGSNLIGAYQYENVHEVLNKNFNYLIISATTFEARVWGGTMSLRSYQQYFQKLNTFFGDLNQKSAQGEPINALGKVIDCLTPWQKTFDYLDPTIPILALNLPAVRFPNTERFITIPSPLVFPINDNVMMQALHKAEKKSTQAMTFKEAPINVPMNAKVILLESMNIITPINIQSDTLPLIIPKDFNINYFLEGLNAPNIMLVPGIPPYTLSNESFSDIIGIVARKIEGKKVSLFIENLTMRLGNNKGINELPANGVITCKAIIDIFESNKQIRICICNNDNCIYRYYDVKSKKWSSMWQSTFENQWKAGLSKRRFTYAPHIMKKGAIEISLQNRKIMDKYLQLKNNPDALKAWQESLSPEQQQRLNTLIKNVRANP
jgi:hypothetical protein